MPACLQMVLDRWLLIFGCFFLFVCTFFCVFLHYSICMCLLVVLVFVFLVFLWWWNLHASVLADCPGQVARDIYLDVSFSCVCFWMFFFLFLFLCLCVGFSCLCFCVGGIWGPACWWMILDRLCSVVVFKFWLLLEVGIVLFFACRGGISINNWIQLFLDNGFLSSEQSYTFFMSFYAWFRLSLSTSTFHMSNKSPLLKKNKWFKQAQLCGRQQSDPVWCQRSGRFN